MTELPARFPLPLDTIVAAVAVSANKDKDYAPLAEQISLHGLGFLQIKLPGNRRIHVWHPDLPRRSCFHHSAIHNHRFSFRSTVLIGEQVNQRYAVWPSEHGSYDRISHDGPRSEKGGRLSFVDGRVNIEPLSREHYGPGESYDMPALHYHETPNAAYCVTLMEKLVEGPVHASSLITHGEEFDQSFDRFQMTPADMWAIFVEAMKG